MIKNSISLLYILFSLSATACKPGASKESYQQTEQQQAGAAQQESRAFTETFEKGSKGGYALAAVTLASGIWVFDNALVGSADKDSRHGSRAARLQSKGTITMNFDISTPVKEVSIASGTFGTDAPATWGLSYSTDAGNNWQQAGSDVTTTSHILNTVRFAVNASTACRFQVRHISGGRLDIDDFSIDGASEGDAQPANTSNVANTPIAGGRDDNMAPGNPSAATAKTTNPNNYLLVKTQYTLSYNNSKGMANWVSWHLSSAWKGDAKRCNCFEPDNELPAGFFRATTHDYTATGFDRGHLCPSDDRDATASDNAATFFMTNMSPQAPHLNQQTWEGLEAYCRKLVQQGNELYIVAGGYGSGGEGSAGRVTTIANGRITVPAHFWKIVIVLPEGSNDISRIGPDTRIIAVDMPNTQSVNQYKWDYYRTTVDAIEAATGYDFLSNVSTTIQKSVEGKTDAGPSR